MNKVAIVNQIIPFSCVDGPGSRLVIFLQGCNFNCKNCHNPHTINLCDSCGDCVSTCPEKALTLITDNSRNQVIWDEELCSQCDICLSVCPKQSTPKIRQYSVEQLIDLIRSQVHFINGVTVSGGEASLQLPFIISLFRAVQSSPDLAHLDCIIDSNGSLSLNGWQQVLPYIKGAMIDLKAWQEDTHNYITGRGNHRIFSTLKMLAEQEKLYEVRLLHIPEVSDFDSEIDAVARYLTQLPSNVRVKLNAFQHHGVTGEALMWPTCTEAQMRQLANALARRGVNNLILPDIYL
ncbi:YjjW family glycine radical enzyme activase [Shewanella sp. KX20019]|uniref:YjjW family glycine radical enzyme activase n=1 Tax=Shewanella sp. KX20019 TaxID=2803864 RepID=UPI00192759BE|nr:YjjW family glycine radical enzyme activase [Shewanella sp. KX20019]QQX79950.1 YjjW family glycine radical enzyme activase [Shewanella sp. KX20019]